MQGHRISKKRIAALIISSIVAIYFLATASYAILNYSDFGSAIPQFVRYIKVPILLAVLVVILAIYLKPRSALLFGIYTYSILFSFFAVEAFLTYRMLGVQMAMLGQVPKSDEQAQSQDLLPGFTLRRLNLKLGTDQLSSSVMSGIPGTNVVLCTPGGEAVSYSADRYGFANDDKIYDDQVDVLIVGDSFIEGFCLDPALTLVAQMQQQGLRTAGMGIRGNGPLIELATIGRYGPSLKPNHVVMAFFEANDWENLEKEFKLPWLEEALLEGADYGEPIQPEAKLTRMDQEIRKDSISEVNVAEVLTRTKIVRNFFALHLTGTSLGLIYPKVHKENQRYVEVLVRAKQLTEQWGGQFSLLYIPQADRFRGLFSMDFAIDDLRHRVLEAAESAGIEVLDLVPVFHGEKNPARFYAADGHFSAEGARFVADWLAGSLKHDSPGASGQLNLTGLTRGKDHLSDEPLSDEEIFID